jgi:hypothetical protein
MAPRIKCPAEEHGINWGLKLDRVDYAEKLQAAVAAHSTANLCDSRILEKSFIWETIQT